MGFKKMMFKIAIIEIEGLNNNNVGTIAANRHGCSGC
jgi:hypothetical protein